MVCIYKIADHVVCLLRENQEGRISDPEFKDESENLLIFLAERVTFTTSWLRRNMMRTIETTARVGEDRKANILLEFPPDVAPGNYKMLVVVEEKAISLANSEKADFDCQSWNWVALPKKAAYRREDIYGDDGR
jgi:hypothetical protein